MAKSNLSKKAKKQKFESKKFESHKILTSKYLRLAVISVLILIAFLLLKNSSYFKLHDIDIFDSSHATDLDKANLLRIYKGRNIFNIDIRSISSQIKSDYPVIKDAVVRRILPNKLEIVIMPRIPIARIRAAMDFPVDRTGMVLSPKIKSGRLPVITGFSVWLRPRVGKKIKTERLKRAFSLIDAINESSINSDYNVTTIDASNHKNFSFCLENGIEVKIGGENFAKRLKELKKNLANPDLDKDNIKYIDLRFKDIVIGPK